MLNYINLTEGHSIHRTGPTSFRAWVHYNSRMSWRCWCDFAKPSIWPNKTQVAFLRRHFIGYSNENTWNISVGFTWMKIAAILDYIFNISILEYQAWVRLVWLKKANPQKGLHPIIGENWNFSLSSLSNNSRYLI